MSFNVSLSTVIHIKKKIGINFCVICAFVASANKIVIYDKMNAKNSILI